MDFMREVTPADLVGSRFIGESNQFAIYATGTEQYLLVQRHESVPWTGVLFSGDGLFRVSGLLAEATRDLYRDVAAHLSPKHHDDAAAHSREDGDGQPRQRIRAVERRSLYEDDLTEERDLSPVARDELARTEHRDPE